MSKYKYTAEESLERIKLFMNYDMSKTLSENRIISEADDIQTDIDAITKELGSTFNVREQDIVDILKKYNTKSKFNGFLKAYKEKTGKDLAKSLASSFQPYNDRNEWADLEKFMKDTLGQNLAFDYNAQTILFDAPQTGYIKTGTPTKTNNPKQNTNTGSAVAAGATNASNKVTYTIPAELKDVEGVKKFQTWLDKNHPGWHAKYKTLGDEAAKGWGTFGPNTNKAWNTQGWKDEYLKNPTGNADLEIEDDNAAPADQPF